jgi:N-acylneuraminate cytidylyltransferase
MIAHPIRIAREAGIFDRIIVSTDDEEIAAVARQYGAEVPFLRPGELADDHTPLQWVTQHLIAELEHEGLLPEWICRIFATAALLVPSDLIQGYEEVRRGATFALGVVPFSHPVQRSLLRDAKGRIQMCQPEFFTSRTQDIPVHYHDAGQFCWGSPAAFLGETPPLLHANSVGVVLPADRAIDIDSEQDWLLAEASFRILHPSDFLH